MNTVTARVTMTTSRPYGLQAGVVGQGMARFVLVRLGAAGEAW